MDIIIDEIKEILKISPARFCQIYYCATIEAVGPNNIKVSIISSFKYITWYKDSYVLRQTEKWNSTGLAIGCLEEYLEDKNFKYTTLISITSNKELLAEININV